MTVSGKTLTLRVPLDPLFLPAFTSMVEHASRAFGMGNGETLKLVLAAEELFTYLTPLADPGQALDAECSDGVYCVRLSVLLPVQPLRMRAFNLTARWSPDSEPDLEDLGLLLAARSVDHLQISERPPRGMHLLLTKEKAYPEEPVPGSGPDPIPLKSFEVISPDPEEVKVLASHVCRFFPASEVPGIFRFPGKLVDMAACGEYGILAARDKGSGIGGGMAWRSQGSGLVEIFGPYVFHAAERSSVARALLDACVGKHGRTEALGVICRYGTSGVPAGYMESLGSLIRRKTSGTPLPQPVLYRQLKEDPGRWVWSHPRLRGFLEAQYDRLYLGRSIQVVEPAGEQRSPFSVFSTEFDRSHGRVTLRPLWEGADAAENLSRHMDLLQGEDVSQVLFELDTGRARQAELAPVLMDGGFEPRLVIPHGGEGDLVVFQYRKDGAGQ